MTWQNVWSAPNRWMARYLKKRGWVVFYLDKQYRTCDAGCWLKLYQESERRVSRN